MEGKKYVCTVGEWGVATDGRGRQRPGRHGLVQWVFRAIKITKDLHRGVNKTKTYSRTTALENGLLRNRRSSPGLTVF